MDTMFQPVEESQSPVLANGIRCHLKLTELSYSNAEQFMMAEKARLFEDRESLEKILETSTPREAKKLGRQVVGFDEKKWNERCFEIVVKGNYHKFNQNRSLKKFLLKTGEKIIVEASPKDRIWGIGLSIKSEKTKDPENWRGSNLLGYALMEVRSALNSNE